jgi:hypothetical protein
MMYYHWNTNWRLCIDLGALQQLNYFEGIELTDDMFMQDTLNDFISDGKKTWRLVRNRIGDIFDKTIQNLEIIQTQRYCNFQNGRCRNAITCFNW